MASCPNNPVLGRNLTDNFDFNEATKQIVPKAGTDTKPGALALNLGNNLPGDTTNATDALTAAGFNAMANAVDPTDPFCGNALQQAVTAAIAQSFACDSAAQQAVACAIAGNAAAVACLSAALPSGVDDTGTVVLDGHPMMSSGDALYRNFIAVKWENGTTTVLASPGSIGPRASFVPFAGDKQNPGKFTELVTTVIGGEVYSVPVAFDPATNTYSTGTPISAFAYQNASRVNHSGTRVAHLEQYEKAAHNIAADGKTLSGRVLLSPDFGEQRYLGRWLGDDLMGLSGNGSDTNPFTKNVVTGATGTTDLAQGLILSVDYSRAASVSLSSGVPVISVYSLVRAGDNVASTLIGTITVPELTHENPFFVSFTWTPDKSQIIVALTAQRGIVAQGIGAPVGLRRNYDSMLFTVNVTATSLAADLSGIRPWGTMGQLENPRISADGNFMIMASFTGTAIFKKTDTKWNQIGHVSGVTSATIVGGAAGHSDTVYEY